MVLYLYMTLPNLMPKTTLEFAGKLGEKRVCTRFHAVHQLSKHNCAPALMHSMHQLSKHDCSPHSVNVLLASLAVTACMRTAAETCNHGCVCGAPSSASNSWCGVGGTAAETSQMHIAVLYSLVSLARCIYDQRRHQTTSRQRLAQSWQHSTPICQHWQAWSQALYTCAHNQSFRHPK